MKPFKYAVEELKNGNRTEHNTEIEAIKHFKKLKKKNISAWIVNIYN